MEKLENNRKWISLGVLGLLIITLGLFYAYWRLTLTQTGINEIASSCFSIVLANEQNEISLQKNAPISDEATLAGGRFRSSNYNYYLYTGNYYWTISPSNFDSFNSANVRFAYNNGIAYYSNLFESNGMRPVINLKTNSLKLGDGTALNPFLANEEI